MAPYHTLLFDNVQLAALLVQYYDFIENASGF